MNIATGQTIYEQILSTDQDNVPVIGVTFDSAMYRDNVLYTAITASISLTDSSRGIYTAEWSASTIGSYQLYVKNNVTAVIFVSDSIIVKTDEELSTNVYIGL